MSGNVTRVATREAVAIAVGLPRAEIDQRARGAFESANDIRARLRGLPDTAKRAHAVSRARTWADILVHMDGTGEEEFCGHLCDNTPPLVAWAAWIAWDWLTASRAPAQGRPRRPPDRPRLRDRRRRPLGPRAGSGIASQARARNPHRQKRTPIPKQIRDSASTTNARMFK